MDLCVSLLQVSSVIELVCSLPQSLAGCWLILCWSEELVLWTDQQMLVLCSSDTCHSHRSSCWSNAGTRTRIQGHMCSLELCGEAVAVHQINDSSVLPRRSDYSGVCSWSKTPLSTRSINPFTQQPGKRRVNRGASSLWMKCQQWYFHVCFLLNSPLRSALVKLQTQRRRLSSCLCVCVWSRACVCVCGWALGSCAPSGCCQHEGSPPNCHHPFHQAAAWLFDLVCAAGSRPSGRQVGAHVDMLSEFGGEYLLVI